MFSEQQPFLGEYSGGAFTEALPVGVVANEWTVDVISRNSCLICPRPHRAEALSDDARPTSVCLSRTSGLSREQRGPGRLKLAQR